MQMGEACWCPSEQISLLVYRSYKSYKSYKSYRTYAGDTNLSVVPRELRRVEQNPINVFDTVAAADMIVIAVGPLITEERQQFRELVVRGTPCQADEETQLQALAVILGHRGDSA